MPQKSWQRRLYLASQQRQQPSPSSRQGCSDSFSSSSRQPRQELRLDMPAHDRHPSNLPCPARRATDADALADASFPRPGFGSDGAGDSPNAASQESQQSLNQASSSSSSSSRCHASRKPSAQQLSCQAAASCVQHPSEKHREDVGCMATAGSSWKGYDSDGHSHASNSDCPPGNDLSGVVQPTRSKPCAACRLPVVVMHEALQGLQSLIAPGLGFGSAGH